MDPARARTTSAALILAVMLAQSMACGVAGDDVCSPASCSGCCTQWGTCVPGTAAMACGGGGGGCVTCAAGELCAAGVCLGGGTCDASTCPNGCCKGAQCVSGTADDACGQGGAGCLACGAGETCSEQTCAAERCDPSSCPNGCCDGTTCRSGTSSKFCGAKGASCAQCADDEVCVEGACEPSPCGPDTCTGCCSAGVCKAGSTAKSCGGNGAACAKCSAGFACDAGACSFSPTAAWKVTVVSAAIRSPLAGGPVWDPDKVSYGLEAPDVYVKVSSGGKSDKTSRKDDTYTPQFNEQVITAKAQDLGQLVNLAVKDYDLIGADQTIGSCSIHFPSSVLLKGSLTVLSCGGPDVVNVRFSFKLK